VETGCGLASCDLCYPDELPDGVEEPLAGPGVPALSAGAPVALLGSGRPVVSLAGSYQVVKERQAAHA